MYISNKLKFLNFITHKIKKLMPIDGIEPPTFALQERRSTTKPNRHLIIKNI